MLSPDSCEEPKCEECGENEYQDEFTHGDTCKRQPYCDPSKSPSLHALFSSNREIKTVSFSPSDKNFQKSDPNSHPNAKKQLLPCLCNLGFHCSSEQCLTCVPHTLCRAGHGAVTTGTKLFTDPVCTRLSC